MQISLQAAREDNPATDCTAPTWPPADTVPRKPVPHNNGNRVLRNNLCYVEFPAEGEGAPKKVAVKATLTAQEEDKGYHKSVLELDLHPRI